MLTSVLASRIAIAGDRLIEMVREVWPDWEQYEDEDYITDGVRHSSE